jgi:hemerythrin-like domain-containing protein
VSAPSPLPIGLSLEELLEALKELNNQHYTFRRRFEDLLKLMDEQPSSAVKDFVYFFENIIVPHFRRESENVFPTILKIAPNDELKKLLERWLAHLEEEHNLLLNRFREGTKELIRMSIRHSEKEEPLYEFVLKEVLRRSSEKQV